MKLSILRPHDLLVLDLELVNLMAAADGTELVRQDPAAAAFVVVHFPPQALAEAVWTGAVAAPPIRTVLAGPSRLVFRLPDGASVPLSVQGLLSWEGWEPVLAPTALARGTAPDPAIPAPALPGALQTAIEFPWRLVLSPDAGGRWRTDNAAAADGAAGGTPAGGTRQQLWSAVLHSADGAGAPAAGTAPGTAAGADVRALASLSGAGGPASPDPFATSLDPGKRHEIVQLSSNFGIMLPAAAGGKPYTPVPLRAAKLELTALGANAELDGAWDFPLIPPEQQPPGFEPLGLRKYQHVAALGRDHFVRTVELGFLCGTGHQAVYIETVERLPAGLAVVEQDPGGALFGAKGYLLKTVEVVIEQQLVDYVPLAGAFAHGGRELPLRSIRLTTRSARIAPSPYQPPAIGPFWLLEPDGAGPLMFHATATDVAGNPLDFSLPLMFVPYECLGLHRDIRAVFDHPPFADAATISLQGQPMAFAPSGDKAGSTQLTTGSVRYDIEQPPNPANPQPGHAMNPAGAPPSYLPRFLPRIAALTASVPAVDDLLGTSVRQELVPDPVYLAQGFDAAGNRAQTFVSFTAQLPLALPTQRGGGLASPASAATALSRSLGPVAAPDQLQLGRVDLSAFADTKLLGTIPLLKLLPANLPFDPAAAGTAPSPQQLDDPHFTLNPPRLTTRRLPAGAAVPATVETRFVWKPPLATPAPFGPLSLNLDDADLLLDSTVTLVEGGASGARVFGRLRNITLTFADALSVRLGTLSFNSEGGGKAEAGAAEVQVTFEGPLAFVNTLQSILPADGFDDPPFLTVDAQGVVTGYTLGVPSVGVGIFSLQNLALSAALSIPFTDRPAGVRFAVSERHKPFLITVSLFGGGGFFAVGVSAQGLEEVEACLEFGGNISLNLGIASGGVYVMAGIYFGMKGGSVELTGYLRCGGYLEVLGLISISLEFYLAFTYRKKASGGSEVWGQASLSVSVRVAFISKSVTLSVERRFAGADGDPSFTESIPPAAWASYLQAFA